MQNRCKNDIEEIKTTYTGWGGEGWIKSQKINPCVAETEHSESCLYVSTMAADSQGWGLLSRFLPFRYFPHFSTSPKRTLAIEYHAYIWRVSPQLSCGDTSQIWMWCKEFNRYFAGSKFMLTEQLTNETLATTDTGDAMNYCNEFAGAGLPWTRFSTPASS